MKKPIKIFSMILIIVFFALTFTACGMFKLDNDEDEDKKVIHPTYSYQGSGTAADPYQVYTREDFTAIGQGQNVYHKLMNNLDLYGDDWASNSPSSIYKNDFDGGGFTISGTPQPFAQYYAFFYELAIGHTIKNLNVVVENKKLPNVQLVGGICADNRGTISNCTVTGTLYSGSETSFVGGIAGMNNGGTITECATDVNILVAKGRSGAGGIAGGSLIESSLHFGTISLCSSKGSITVSGAGVSVGGIVAHGMGSVKQCFSEMQIEMESTTAFNAATSYIGGIAAGYFKGSVGVQDCYFSGNIKAKTNNAYVGGLIGFVDSDSYANMTTSYVNADIIVSTDSVINIVLGNNKADAFFAGSTKSGRLTNCFNMKTDDLLTINGIQANFERSIWNVDTQPLTLKGVKTIL